MGGQRENVSCQHSENIQQKEKSQLKKRRNNSPEKGLLQCSVSAIVSEVEEADRNGRRRRPRIKSPSLLFDTPELQQTEGTGDVKYRTVVLERRPSTRAVERSAQKEILRCLY
ncbi:hypothetical protein RRG08_053196 [Elysia crispata]|uniref:Uncharacterized protein n=1 Tax=Elysia crispata TaxID=231223 RepID=A0AAE1AXP5_9GAST|nr:hypothetical protein RRG08_053196 [Elysia crispata]